MKQLVIIIWVCYFSMGVNGQDVVQGLQQLKTAGSFGFISLLRQSLSSTTAANARPTSTNAPAQRSPAANANAVPSSSPPQLITSVSSTAVAGTTSASSTSTTIPSTTQSSSSTINAVAPIKTNPENSDNPDSRIVADDTNSNTDSQSGSSASMTSSNPNTSFNQNGSLHAGTIAGIVIGVFIAVSLSVFGIYRYAKHPHRVDSDPEHSFETPKSTSPVWNKALQQLPQNQKTLAMDYKYSDPTNAEPCKKSNKLSRQMDFPTDSTIVENVSSSVLEQNSWNLADQMISPPPGDPFSLKTYSWKSNTAISYPSDGSYDTCLPLPSSVSSFGSILSTGSHFIVGKRVESSFFVPQMAENTSQYAPLDVWVGETIHVLQDLDNGFVVANTPEGQVGIIPKDVLLRW